MITSGEKRLDIQICEGDADDVIIIINSIGWGLEMMRLATEKRKKTEMENDQFHRFRLLSTSHSSTQSDSEQSYPVAACSQE